MHVITECTVQFPNPSIFPGNAGIYCPAPIARPRFNEFHFPSYQGPEPVLYDVYILVRGRDPVPVWLRRGVYGGLQVSGLRLQFPTTFPQRGQKYHRIFL